MQKSFWNESITNKSLTLILAFAVIVAGGVGVVIGKFTFGDDILSYQLQPDYLVTSKPEPVRYLTSDLEIQKLSHLYYQGKIHFRDISLLKKGKYLILGRDGLHIAKDTETTKLTPITKRKSVNLGDYTFVATHMRERTPQYLDHIETQEELRSLRKVADEVANPQDIKLGAYITKTSQQQEGKFKYNVKENGLEGKLKVIKLGDPKSQD